MQPQEPSSTISVGIAPATTSRIILDMQAPHHVGVTIPRVKLDVFDSQVVLAAWVDTIVLTSNAIRSHRASRTLPTLRRELDPGALACDLTVLCPPHNISR